MLFFTLVLVVSLFQLDFNLHNYIQNTVKPVLRTWNKEKVAL